MDHRAVLDHHARTENHVRLDRHVAAELGVCREEHGLRRLHGHAGFERRFPQAFLQHGFRLRQLGLGIDATHFVLLHLDRRRFQPSSRAIDTASVR